MRHLIFTLIMLISLPTAAKTLKLDPKRSIEVKGVINKVKDYKIKASTLQDMAKDKEKPIFIRIDSPGGNMFAGLELYRMMDRVKDRGANIKCLVENDAASMAFIIYSMCSEHFALSSSTMLWHPIRVRMGGMFGTPLTAVQMFDLAKDIVAWEKYFNKRIIRDLKIDKKFYYKHFYKETSHLAEELHKKEDFFTIVKDYL